MTNKNSPIIPFLKGDENKSGFTLVELNLRPVFGTKKLIQKTGLEQAFTLVELIVVITILAILSTIGFVSYSSYLAGSRDTNRISQIKAISEGLYLYSTNHSLPTPDDKVDILSNTTVIAYQGYAGSNVLETITYSTEGVDPKDKTYFSYYLTKDKKHFQLMAFLEEEDNLQTTANAIDYSKRYPTVYGKKLGILTDINNTPIQELGITELDVATVTEEYIARLKDSEDIIKGTGSILLSGAISNMVGRNKKSCKDILDSNSYSLNSDGLYWITIDGEASFQVYCDMTTSGGGWTLLVTSKSIGGWVYSEVVEKNPTNPSILEDYSILGRGDSIKTIINGKFQYRLDASSFGEQGGVFEVPESYSFTSTSNLNTDVTMLDKYLSWSESSTWIDVRMPYMCDTTSGLLSSSESCTSSRRGTILAYSTAFDPAPRLSTQPGIIWYWVK